MPQVPFRSTLSPRCQPFLYLATALVAGIVIDRWVEPRAPVIATFALVFVTAFLALFVRKKSSGRDPRIAIKLRGNRRADRAYEKSGESTAEP